MLVLIYTNEGDNAKRFKARKYYLPKNIMKSYNVIINEKKLLWSANWFRYKAIWRNQKSRTVQDEDYAKGCLLDYDCTKNDYILIAVDLSRQKEVDADPNAIQQIQLIGKFKKTDAKENATDAGGNDQPTFVLIFLKSIKEAGLKFSQGGLTVL